MKHEIETSTFQNVVQLSAHSSRTQRTYLCANAAQTAREGGVVLMS